MPVNSPPINIPSPRDRTNSIILTQAQRQGEKSGLLLLRKGVDVLFFCLCVNCACDNVHECKIVYVFVPHGHNWWPVKQLDVELIKQLIQHYVWQS